MRMLARGGNAVDGGVAATFAAAVTRDLALRAGRRSPDHHPSRRPEGRRRDQRPGARSARRRRRRPSGRRGGFPRPARRRGPCRQWSTRSPSRSRSSARCPSRRARAAVALADGFPWYGFLTRYLEPERERMLQFPSGARVYLQGPDMTVPSKGSLFRQPDLARTLRALVEAEQQQPAPRPQGGDLCGAGSLLPRRHRPAYGPGRAGGRWPPDRSGPRSLSWPGGTPHQRSLHDEARHLRGLQDRLLGARAGPPPGARLLRASTSSGWATTPGVHPYRHGSAEAVAGGPGRVLR